MRIAVATCLTILLLALLPTPVAAKSHRLPKGYHWGRCLLVVAGKTLISGRCGYEIRAGGAFYMAGPRQIYEGVDYQNPGGFGAGQRSADHWAAILKESDGSWWGYTNARDIRATHGDVSFRTLTRKGACFLGETDTGQTEAGKVLRGKPVKACLWRQ